MNSGGFSDGFEPWVWIQWFKIVYASEFEQGLELISGF